MTELYTVLHLAPASSEALEDLGDLYLRRGEYAAATKHYEEAAKLSPDRDRIAQKLQRARRPAVEARLTGELDAR